MSEPLATPAVLLLGFNRPAEARRTLATIRAARPARLYLAVDGPRSGRAGEGERCAAVRALVHEIDWPCRVATRFREHNLGCRRAVPDAISWFFAHEHEGLVIEDDCVPAPDFFRYAAFALAHWRDDARVLHVGGVNHVPRAEPLVYSRLVPIHGWATWRRAWALYDDSMQRLAELRALPLEAWYGRQAPRVLRAIEGVHHRALDAWGARWVLAVMLARGLSVLPGVNLVSNIGYGPAATHTKLRSSHLAEQPTGALPALPAAPANEAVDAAADEAYLEVINRRGPLVPWLMQALRNRLARVGAAMKRDGVAAARDELNAEPYAEHYAEQYANWHPDTPEHRAEMDVFYARVLAPVLATLPKDARILDVGCGTGLLVHALRGLGYAGVRGIDRSASQIAVAQRLGLPCTCTERLGGEPLDAIFLLDVLEHLAVDEQPRLLSQLAERLAPGGRIVISVPNANAAFAARQRWGDWEHRSAFTEHSLAQVLRMAGFGPMTLHPHEYGRRLRFPWLHQAAFWTRLLRGAFRAFRRLEAVAEFGRQGLSMPLALNLLAEARVAAVGDAARPTPGPADRV